MCCSSVLTELDSRRLQLFTFDDHFLALGPSPQRHFSGQLSNGNEFTENCDAASHHMHPGGSDNGAHAPMVVGTTTCSHVASDFCCVPDFSVENSREF